MPRVKRKGHARRAADIPLSEWTPAQLKAELKRLETDPDELNAWQALKRTSELQREIDARERTSESAMEAES